MAVHLVRGQRSLANGIPSLLSLTSSAATENGRNRSFPDDRHASDRAITSFGNTFDTIRRYGHGRLRRGLKARGQRRAVALATFCGCRAAGCQVVRETGRLAPDAHSSWANG